MQIVVAPDKFKGTASAADVVRAIAAAVEAAGHTFIEMPMADGGEGTLQVLGGANRQSTVTGPVGSRVDASWRIDEGTAVIEMAQAAGLVLAGGREANDPVMASTRGVGELIIEAVGQGAERIIVGVGGSATTDGGLGAVEAIGLVENLSSAEIEVACDVRTHFVEAAAVFGPQKGASSEQVAILTERLETLATHYFRAFNVDVSSMPRAGAAGGLAGGLAALGARLVDGFELVAEATGLDAAIAEADLVITGEGALDAESFNGKVVGGVTEIAQRHEVPVLAIAGQISENADGQIDAISLVSEFGIDLAMSETTSCITKAVTDWLERS